MSEQGIPAEDAWAYEPEHRDQVQRGLEDVEAGRVRQVSDEELAAVDEDE